MGRVESAHFKHFQRVNCHVRFHKTVGQFGGAAAHVGNLMKVMVTGGAGFIGSHLCDKLLGEAHDVWCLDNFETGHEANLVSALENPRFSHIRGDVREAWPDVKVDQVYNLACPGAPAEYRRDGISTLRTSFIGTLNALDYCERNGARLLYASTGEIYDLSPLVS